MKKIPFRPLSKEDKETLLRCAEKNIKVKEGLENGCSLVSIINAVVEHSAQEKKGLLLFVKKWCNL